MPDCPYCLEEIKVGARKCSHCQTSLESDSDTGDTTVLIVDQGLIRFAKFAIAILSIFGLVGLSLFGFNLEEAKEKTYEAKIEVQKAILEIQKQKVELGAKISEIEKQFLRIEEIENKVAKSWQDLQKTAAQVEKWVRELHGYREEAFAIMEGIRQLKGTEKRIAETQREERGIRADRGKLWSNDSTLKFYFLDGEEREKKIVRDALNQYCGHILGCLLINDAVIAKGFVLWTGFVQTLPIG